jgi:hypothetical protein
MIPKRFIPCCLLIFAFSSCKPNYGSLTGNVYWKYNNYVGDKPDAGSDVYLFSQDTSKAPLETTCDVQGNFRFDKIPTGNYMLVVRSKNTTNSASNELEELFTKDTYSYFGFVLRDLDSALLKNAINSYFDFQKRDLSPPPSYTYKQKMAYYDSAQISQSMANRLADSLLNKIPKDNRLMKEIYFLGSFFPKVKFKEITIKKNDMSNEVFDFGITYY